MPHPAPPRSAQSSPAPPALSPGQWLMAVVVTVCAMALLQLAQHLFFMNLPMFWYHATAAALNSAAVTVIIVLYLTWRRTALAAEEALRLLQTSERLREDLTSMLVHDLKHPLTASLLGSRILLERRDALEPAEREMLAIAIQNQTRLVGMIEDLLDIARAEGDHMPVHLEPTDLAVVINAVLDEAAPQAHGAGLALAVGLVDCPLALCDADKTRRILADLLANALKFTPAGGHVTVSLRPVGGEAQVTVRDDGPGIPESLHDRIFEKYAQAEAAATGHRMSVGLGLTFCKLATEAQGGRVWVDSGEGRGSAFTVALPLASPA
jgi:two-component system, sensor histidine kinase and response regulator